MKDEFCRLNEPPKIFTFGLGKDYNENKMRDLAGMSGSDHIYLKIITEFKQRVSTHLSLYCQAIGLVTFVQEKFDENGEEAVGRKNEIAKITFRVKIRGDQIVAANNNNT